MRSSVLTLISATVLCGLFVLYAVSLPQYVGVLVVASVVSGLIAISSAVSVLRTRVRGRPQR